MGEHKENTTQDRPVCFVIMPFSDPQSYEPGHFRKIYDQIFVPAIEEAGYTPLRVDDEFESSIIHAKLLNRLVTAPMVLCDISSKNPNVLYELGIRHAFDLPVVLVQESGQSHIFDISGITTIEYRKKRLYDEVIEDQKKISRAIMDTASSQRNYSIISLAQIQPATIDKEQQISDADRIQIMVADLSRKMDRLESELSRNKGSCSSAVIPEVSMPPYDKAMQDEIRLSAIRAIKRAETLCRDYDANPNNILILPLVFQRRNDLVSIRQEVVQSPYIDTGLMQRLDAAIGALDEFRAKIGKSKTLTDTANGDLTTVT